MPKSLRAHFLMAVKGLRDPNFYKSVVLMVELGWMNTNPGRFRAEFAVGHMTKYE